MFNLRKKITGNAGSSAPNGRENLKNRFHKKQDLGLFLETQEWSPDGLKAQSLRARTPSIFCLSVPSHKTQIPGREPLNDWSHVGHMDTSWPWEAGDRNGQSLHGDIQIPIEAIINGRGMDVGQWSWQLTVTYVLLSATLWSTMTPIWHIKGREQRGSFDGRGEGAQQVQASSPRDLNLPAFRAQLPHYYDFPLAAKSKLFPLQANWAGPWKVPWIPNGRNMKEKRMGTDQDICHGMCGIFTALAARREAVSSVNVTAREKHAWSFLWDSQTFY